MMSAYSECHALALFHSYVHSLSDAVVNSNVVNLPVENVSKLFCR